MAQAEARRTLNDTLHIQYGHHLFASKEYDEAMAHFGMCSSASPVVLLRLFPSLASPAMLEPLLHTVAGKSKAHVIPCKPEKSAIVLCQILKRIWSSDFGFAQGTS